MKNIHVDVHFGIRIVCCVCEGALKISSSVLRRRAIHYITVIAVVDICIPDTLITITFTCNTL